MQEQGMIRAKIDRNTKVELEGKAYKFQKELDNFHPDDYKVVIYEETKPLEDAWLEIIKVLQPFWDERDEEDRLDDFEEWSNYAGE